MPNDSAALSLFVAFDVWFVLYDRLGRAILRYGPQWQPDSGSLSGFHSATRRIAAALEQRGISSGPLFDLASNLRGATDATRDSAHTTVHRLYALSCAERPAKILEFWIERFICAATSDPSLWPPSVYNEMMRIIGELHTAALEAGFGHAPVKWFNSPSEDYSRGVQGYDVYYPDPEIPPLHHTRLASELADATDINGQPVYALVFISPQEGEREELEKVLRPWVALLEQGQRQAAEETAPSPAETAAAMKEPHPQRCWIAAWDSLQRAGEAEPELGAQTLKKVYAWLNENDPSPDYMLPPRGTWEKYIRAYKKATGRTPPASKRRGRAGRSITRIKDQ